jgi:FkbM family methyltransferase
MTFNLRDGSRIRSRIADSGGLLSVYVDGDYAIPGFDWSGARNIVDIGAHIGSFTVWAARKSASARVLAVEPNPETFQRLRDNIVRNGLDSRVTALAAAVGPEPGTSSLELVDHSLGTRLARRSGPADGPTVVVQTLDQLLDATGMDSIDFLKIDCEGLEYDVIDQVDPAILMRVKALACEFHPEPGRDVQLLDRRLGRAGFRVQRPDAPIGVLWATR